MDALRFPSVDAGYYKFGFQSPLNGSLKGLEKAMEISSGLDRAQKKEIRAGIPRRDFFCLLHLGAEGVGNSRANNGGSARWNLEMLAERFLDELAGANPIRGL